MIPAFLTKIGNGIRGLCGTGMIFAKAHAGEIAVGGGIAGVVLTVIETVKATNKTNDILEEKEAKLSHLPELDEGDEASTDILNRDTKLIKRQAKTAIIRTWIPVGTTLTVSIFLILKGYKIINGRYVATATAYKVLEETFNRYRQNVTEEYGKDVDWEMLNRMTVEDFDKDQAARKENKELIANGKKPRTLYNRDIHSQIFDQYSDRWQMYWTPDLVWDYLVRKEAEMNDKLRIQKHLFVNEVWDALGLDRTPEGQITGWIITKNNPNSRVDFGLNDIPEDRRREFLRDTMNEDIWLRIRLNPDGVIYNMIDKTARLYA